MSVSIHTAEKTELAVRKKHFLPYQNRWLADQPMFKISEKSRQIGMTYVQAYEDVRECVKSKKQLPVWFSSADESAAREYILYCDFWIQKINAVAKDLGEIVIDEKDNVKALAIEFENGARIHALRSNPKAFRSKHGKVVLDEFAHHDDQFGLWMAAKPSTTWGYPVRILSTHNGKGCLYFKILDDAKQKISAGLKTPWSVHTTDIFTAVREGLADKILDRELTEAERQGWIDEQHAACLLEEIWMQEYCCVPLDEATAFLPYDLIATVEDEHAGDPSLYAGGPVYIGVDIGRRRDLFVICVKEKVGDVKWTRELVALKGANFATQDKELDRIVKAYPSWVRMCIDQTGMGEKPVEDAKRRYGTHKVEGVLFTNEVKQELANTYKRSIEDKLQRIPKTPEMRDDLHAVKKITTIAGNVRFDAERTAQGHADRFWAEALAHHAGDKSGTPGALEYLGMLVKQREAEAQPEAVQAEKSKSYITVTVTTKEGW